MAARNNSLSLRIAFSLGLFLLCGRHGCSKLSAQAPAAAPAAAASQLGTVKAISGTSITMATDKGADGDGDRARAAKVLQLAGGQHGPEDGKAGADVRHRGGRSRAGDGQGRGYAGDVQSQCA